MGVKVIKAKEVKTHLGPGAGRCKLLVDKASTGQDRFIIVWVTFPPGQGSDEHVRDFDECLYVLKGTCRVITSEGEHFDHSPGDCIYIPRGVKHRHLCISEEPLEQLAIFPPGLEEGLKSLPCA